MTPPPDLRTVGWLLLLVIVGGAGLALWWVTR